MQNTRVSKVIQMANILIVGGGPSGLACAISILKSSSSHNVTIIEKRLNIGINPRCAGGVSKYLMEKVGFSVPESSIVARVRKVRIYAPNLKYWELKGDEDYGYVLNRERFEQSIAEGVEQQGGRINLGSFVSLLDMNEFVKNYDYVVGADGPVSIVREWLRLPRYSLEDVHIGVQKTIPMDYYPKDTIELYFGEEVAPQGYAWIFPCGDGMVRVGLGVPSPKGSSAMLLLDRFISRQVYDCKVVDSVGKQIPTAKMPRTGVYGKVLLVGDALPSTDPLTGGGISQGIATGKAAAWALAEGKPENYDTYIGWLKKQNNWRYRLKHVLYSFNDRDFNDLIEVLQDFRPKTLSVGKELRRAVVRLVWKKPSLLSKFFKF